MKQNEQTAQSPEVETRLLSISKAAERLGLSRATISLLIEQGRLEVVNLNGTRRVRLQSLIDFSKGKKADHE